MIRWTNEEINKLYRLWRQGKNDEEIAKEFGTTIFAIKAQRKKRHFVQDRSWKTFKKWTMQEIDFLKQLAPRYTCAEIADILGRSYRSVSEKAQQLHIKIKSVRSDYGGSSELSKEYRNMGDGPHRGYTKTTDMLIMQFLSEGHSLQSIAEMLGRDYEDLKQCCEQNAEQLHKAHIKMLAYGGVYAERLRKRKGEIA